MKGDRIAVIDLGSNTFHLLICEIVADGSWKVLHKEREYVKLASGGINSIDEDSVQRALDAMIRFMNLIQTFDVRRTRAIGTAALREAENGLELAAKLAEITGIEIDIIDGQREAAYILKGIRSALPDLDQPSLIMDIGGGSVEFVMYKGDKVAFAQSYKIGVAVLYREFHHSDPIHLTEIDALEAFVGRHMDPMLKVILQSPHYYLIGASGSFEVLYDGLPKKSSGEHWAELDISGILENLNMLIALSLEERKQMAVIPPERVDYIVVAYLLIRYLILTVPPARLYYCDYALKEGIVAEMIDEIF